MCSKSWLAPASIPLRSPIFSRYLGTTGRTRWRDPLLGGRANAVGMAELGTRGERRLHALPWHDVPGGDFLRTWLPSENGIAMRKASKAFNDVVVELGKAQIAGISQCRE